MHSTKGTGGSAALVVAGALLLYLVLGPGLHGLAGFGAGVAAGLLFAYGGYTLLVRPEPPSPRAPAASDQATAPIGDRAPSNADVLNAINVRVRSAGFTSDLVERIERLIDQLSEILPTLSSQFAGFELTWQMQQIASAYLPKLVNAYADLNEVERPQKRGDFEESLRELEDAAARTARALQDQKTTEFENISRFLRLRFS